MKVISIISLVLFVKTGFYRDKRSNFFYLIFLFSLIIAIINPILSLNYVNMRVTINILYSTGLILSNLWQFYACVEMSKKLKPIKLAPYIKKRYKLFGISAILFAFVGFEVIFAHTASTPELAQLGEIIVLLTGSIITVFLAFIWVMPKSMKNFLNREFQPKYQKTISNVERTNNPKQN